MARSEELQRQTLRILTQLGSPGKPLSARAAGEKLEIGYNQIADMARGKIPAEKTLIRFAHAIDEDPSAWLRYAGKHDFARTLDHPTAGAAETEADKNARIIARELSRLPAKLQPVVFRQLIAVIQAVQEPSERKTITAAEGESRTGGLPQ